MNLKKNKNYKNGLKKKGVRSVKNAIKIKGSNFRSTAKDILITSQLRSAQFSIKLQARNYTLETINKNIYIFGAMDQKEKKEVINEANKIYDVNKLYPSIYLVTELSRNKL